MSGDQVSRLIEEAIQQLMTISGLDGEFLPYDALFHALQRPGPTLHLVCEGCRVVLMYPDGSDFVCCFLCGYYTIAPSPRIPLARVFCGGCEETLIYPAGAGAVQCANCEHITRIIPVEQAEEVEAVIVENPVTMSEDGRLVRCMSIGLKR